MVLFTRLRGEKKGREFRVHRKCRGVWGFKGNLYDVQVHKGTFRNPKNVEVNPKKAHQKRKKLGEGNEFHGVKVGQKGQGRCGSVSRDREETRYMTIGQRQRNLYLFWSKAQSEEKRHQIDAVEETAWRKKRESG
jgi:Zn-finger nucleic acid-binding protein